MKGRRYRPREIGNSQTKQKRKRDGEKKYDQLNRLTTDREAVGVRERQTKRQQREKRQKLQTDRQPYNR